MGLKLSCLKGLKTCVSGGSGERQAAAGGEKHLRVPAIIVTPPTPTGTMLAREPRGGQTAGPRHRWEDRGWMGKDGVRNGGNGWMADGWYKGMGGCTGTNRRMDGWMDRWIDG
uniref:Uncharacterized protein n=1 Tax=Dromaius novaehollandiae TaxID=8790 RepID=A0A8C4P4L7_DRONO